MDRADDEFVPAFTYRVVQGCPTPELAVHVWLREQGVTGLTFAADDVCVTAPCGRLPDGSWDTRIHVRVRASLLRRAGLRSEDPAEG